MSKTLFSIVCPDNAQTLIEQTRLLRMLNPQCSIVVYLSEEVRQSSADLNWIEHLSEVPNLVINTAAFRLNKPSVLHAHVDNVKGQLSDHEWERVCFLSSGDLPIRRLSEHSNRVTYKDYDPTWFFDRAIKEDKLFGVFCAKANITTTKFETYEGSVFSRQLAEEFVSYFSDADFDTENYPRHEVFFHTFAHARGIESSPPITHALGHNINLDREIIGAYVSLLLTNVPDVPEYVTKWLGQYTNTGYPENMCYLTNLPREPHNMLRSIIWNRMKDLGALAQMTGLEFPAKEYFDNAMMVTPLYEEFLNKFVPAEEYKQGAKFEKLNKEHRVLDSKWLASVSDGELMLTDQQEGGFFIPANELNTYVNFSQPNQGTVRDVLVRISSQNVNDLRKIYAFVDDTQSNARFIPYFHVVSQLASGDSIVQFKLMADGPGYSTVIVPSTINGFVKIFFQ